MAGHVLAVPRVRGASRVEVVTLNPVLSLQHPRPGPLATLRGSTCSIPAPLVAPVSLHGVVLAAFPVPAVAAEQPRQVLGVFEALLDDDRRVGEVQDVLV